MRGEFKILFIVMPILVIGVSTVGLLVHYEQIEAIWLWIAGVVAAIFCLILGVMAYYRRGLMG